SSVLDLVEAVEKIVTDLPNANALYEAAKEALTSNATAAEKISKISEIAADHQQNLDTAHREATNAASNYPQASQEDIRETTQQLDTVKTSGTRTIRESAEVAKDIAEDE
ncbi:MAG: hypothetical protein Q9203_007782, partial [Teloschistes exilis]